MTFLINENDVNGKLLAEFLKTLPYVIVVPEEQKMPNKETVKAIEELKAGKGQKFKNSKELFAHLRD